MAKPDKKTVLKVVLRSSRSSLKVIWSYGPQIWAYKVSRSEILAASDKCRTALHHLLKDAAPNREDNEYRDELRALARAGMDLYYAAMTGTAGTEEMAAEFEGWFREQTNAAGHDLRIDVIFDSEVIAPWGLIFSPIPDGDLARTGGSAEEFSNFWCTKHRLSCYSETQSLEDGEEPPVIDGRITELFVALDGGLRDRTDPYLAIYTVTSRDRMEYRSKHALNFHQLIYMNLPMQNGELVIGSEKLPPNVFKSMGHFLQHYSIVFVDQTAVIYGPNGKSWIEAFHSKWDGFIGVETDIPDNDYLKLYGLRFIKELVSSTEKLEYAVSKMRARHWPISLAYGVYCNPSRFFIKPSPDFLGDVDQLLGSIYIDHAVVGEKRAGVDSNSQGDSK